MQTHLVVLGGSDLNVYLHYITCKFVAVHISVCSAVMAVVLYIDFV